METQRVDWETIRASLVTGDRDLLALGAFHYIRIVTARQYLDS